MIAEWYFPKKIVNLISMYLIPMYEMEEHFFNKNIFHLLGIKVKFSNYTEYQGLVLVRTWAHDFINKDDQFKGKNYFHAPLH